MPAHPPKFLSRHETNFSSAFCSVTRSSLFTSDPGKKQSTNMSLSLKIVLILLALVVPFCQCISKSLFINNITTNYNISLHNLDTVTVTYEENNIANGETVDIVEDDDFNFTCFTSNEAVDIILNTDIDVPGSRDNYTRDFYLLNVHRNLTGTEFTCTDTTDSITFTLNVQC